MNPATLTERQAPFGWQLRRDFRLGYRLTHTISGSLLQAPGLLVSIIAIVLIKVIARHVSPGDAVGTIMPDRRRDVNQWTSREYNADLWEQFKRQIEFDARPTRNDHYVVR
jgi:hypothetical protein